MLARIFPGVIPPTLGTATLVEVAPAAFSNPYNYSYRVNIAVTINGSAPPGSAGWGVYVSAGPTNTLFNGSASTTQTLSLGVNNLQITLGSGALPSYYLRVEVYTQDPFGNIAIIQRSSNICLLYTSDAADDTR